MVGGRVVLLAYRFRARPDRAQRILFERTAGCCRVLYNAALEQRQRAYQQRRTRVRYVQQAAELRALKEAFPFFAEVPHHCLQVSLRNLETAFVRFFRKEGGYPRFKRKGAHDSFTFPDRKQIVLEQPEGEWGRRGRLKLPKAGWVSFVRHRRVVGEVRSVTVSREVDGWYVSVLTAREVEEPALVRGEAVGVDVGVVNAVVLSTGDRFGVPGLSPGERERLGRLQRRLARQVKGSASRARTKRAIAKLHQRGRRRRADALHKITHHLTTQHRLIVLEKLRVRSMTRSARGSLEAPGRNVRQKAGLNRAILEVGWAELRRQVAYKALRAGSSLVLLENYAFTSRACSVCGFTAATNRRSQAEFLCGVCGHAEHADVNAAKNILARGTRVTAGGALDDGSGYEAGTPAVQPLGCLPEASAFAPR